MDPMNQMSFVARPSAQSGLRPMESLRAPAIGVPKSCTKPLNAQCTLFACAMIAVSLFDSASSFSMRLELETPNLSSQATFRMRCCHITPLSRAVRSSLGALGLAAAMRGVLASRRSAPVAGAMLASRSE